MLARIEEIILIMFESRFPKNVVIDCTIEETIDDNLDTIVLNVDTKKFQIETNTCFTPFQTLFQSPVKIPIKISRTPIIVSNIVWSNSDKIEKASIKIGATKLQNSSHMPLKNSMNPEIIGCISSNF